MTESEFLPMVYTGMEEITDYKKAKVVVLPLPYEGTVSYGKGASKGPDGIIDASRNMELYDEEIGKEIYKIGIHTAEPVEVKDTPKEMIEEIHRATKKYLKDGKFVIGLGGEHSVTFGEVKAFKEKYPKLSVLQFDAHSDLRDKYDETPFSHACVMRRIIDIAKITQVGIRSMCQDEVDFIKKTNKTAVFYAKDIHDNDKWMDKAIATLEKDVFITIDIDVFDPSIMSATGTPEPGGLQWYQVLRFLKKVFKKKNVVGCDVVELAPVEGNKAPDFLASKLVYKLIGYKFFN